MTMGWALFFDQRGWSMDNGTECWKKIVERYVRCQELLRFWRKLRALDPAIPTDLSVSIHFFCKIQIYINFYIPASQQSLIQIVLMTNQYMQDTEQMAAGYQRAG